MTIPPATEPVDLATVKDHCRVPQSDTTQDARLTQYVREARQRLENDTERALITQTRQYAIDRFCDVLELPGVPLASVSSVQYFDTDGAQQTVPVEVYEERTDAKPGVIAKLPGQSWPTVQAGRFLPITITYVCGVDGTTVEVPLLSTEAILLLVSHWYEHRTEAQVGNLVPIPIGYESLARSLAIRLRRSDY